MTRRVEFGTRRVRRPERWRAPDYGPIFQAPARCNITRPRPAVAQEGTSISLRSKSASEQLPHCSRQAWHSALMVEAFDLRHLVARHHHVEAQVPAAQRPGLICRRSRAGLLLLPRGRLERFPRNRSPPARACHRPLLPNNCKGDGRAEKKARHRYNLGNVRSLKSHGSPLS
jgi:hypothetical protein